MQSQKRYRQYNTRALHNTFTTIYALIAVFWLGAPVFFVNYEVVFQSGLMGFFIGTAFLMLSATIVGKEAIRNRTSHHFMLTYRHSIGIIFCAAAALALSLFYLWNIAHTLTMCDSFLTNATEPVTAADLDSSVELLVSYRANQRLRVLRATYNEEGTLLLGTKKRSASSNATSPPPSYTSLQQEVKTLIVKHEQRYSYKKQMATMATMEAMNEGIETTSRAEDVLFQELRARKICRNEQGFAIAIAILIIVMGLLDLTTIAVYIWMRTLV